MMHRAPAAGLAALLFVCGIRAASVGAPTDEIQVYNAEIADPGIFNLTWHNNYTTSGATRAKGVTRG